MFEEWDFYYKKTQFDKSKLKWTILNGKRRDDLQKGKSQDVKGGEVHIDKFDTQARWHGTRPPSTSRLAKSTLNGANKNICRFPQIFWIVFVAYFGRGFPGFPSALN